MKNPRFFLFILLAFTLSSTAQNFIWVRGSNTAYQTGSYGTQGVASSGNDPCGRHGCGKWVDANGNLWMFGGEGPTNTWHNDLWKYDISTNEWTWIRGSQTGNVQGNYGTMGVASPTNDPGSREFMATWVDLSGNLWLFGGDGYGTSSQFGRLGDLWKYNISTNQWTWIRGFNAVMQNGNYSAAGVFTSTNDPGCRLGAGMWTDPATGDFWMFGGRGFVGAGSQGYLNDLWRYHPATNQWAWISGSNQTGQYGNYGTLGTPSATNAPGGRYLPGFWGDASGNLYMLGGFGFALSTNTISVDYLNDFWKYDPVANTWTWIGGSTSVDVFGTYGTQGVPSTTYMPGSRRAHACWTDANGNFWLFGGEGFDISTPSYSKLNDVWKYNPTTAQWTWIKGSSLGQQNGTYGTLGVGAPGNIPGGRDNNTWWKDHNGKFWLFGGEGFDASSTTINHQNDLWVYSTPCNPDSVTVVPGKIFCSGASATLTAVNGGPSTVWYPTASSTASIAGGSTLAVTSLTAAGSSAVYSYYAEANSCTTAPRAFITLTVNALPTVTAAASATSVCKGTTVSITAGGANSYSLNVTPFSPTLSTIVVNPSVTITYTITGTDTHGCENTTTLTVKVNSCLGISEIQANSALCTVFPNPSSGSFVLEIEKEFKQGKLELLNALGQKVFEQNILSEKTVVQPGLARGVYYYRLNLDGQAGISGRLIME